MAAPAIIAGIKFVAQTAIAYALNKVKGLFNWKERDEVNRFEDRKAECIAFANQLESGLTIMISRINNNTYPLSEAITEHNGQVERWNRFTYYIPLGSIPWAPFRPFDYPSEEAGVTALLEILKQWMPMFEKVLDTAFPTYNWQFVSYKRSPSTPFDSASDPATLQAGVKKLAIPAGLLALGLVLSSS